MYYYSIDKTAVAEFKDRGSRFIAYVYPLKDAEDFKKILQGLKKEHPKAVHHCFAYRYEVLVNPDIFGNNVISTKHNQSSDDGEPASTAGKPIMQILEK